MELKTRLAAIEAAGLRRGLRRMDAPTGRVLRWEGRGLLNFSSNDYLGLADHPAVKSGAARALAEFGAGAGASRLICGSLAPQHELEAELAAFKGTPAALVFGSGYAAAGGVLGALLGSEDVVVLDKLVHASIVDAARLSGAKLRVFPHNDLTALAEILRWAAARPAGADRRPGRTLVVTESIFSMDGDTAPLREIVELKDECGAWLMVDEAHATGLLGMRGGGLAEALGVADRIEVQMGTLGKALGAAGGYVCGGVELIDYLVNRARPFIFSTAPVPAAAGAALAALAVVQSAEGAARRARVAAHGTRLRTALVAMGWPVPPGGAAILPLVLGGEAAAVATADRLRERGVFAPAIRYPTVARGRARLRVTLSAAHTEADVELLLEALSELTPPLLPP